MSAKSTLKEVIKSWDEKARQWKTLMGDHGDHNRLYNSDPVLWKFLGNVTGKKVLDAGCGTGYLSVLLSEKLATVIGIDISEKMIQEAKAFAKQKDQPIDFRVDSCSEMASLTDGTMDLVVSNYVLMDLPDLEGAVKSTYRVLKSKGKAVCIFSHPCNSDLKPNEMYFDEIMKKDSWGPFQSEFIYFHRPLSAYWKAFRNAGFNVEDFDEPVAQNSNIQGLKAEWCLKYRKQAWSVAFLLVKP